MAPVYYMQEDDSGSVFLVVCLSVCLSVNRNSETTLVVHIFSDIFPTSISLLV